MNDVANKTLVVTKAEIHYWPTCPCIACKNERTRQESISSTPIRQISVEIAHTLGFIPFRYPEGSLTKKIVKALSPQ